MLHDNLIVHKEVTMTNGADIKRLINFPSLTGSWFL